MTPQEQLALWLDGTPKCPNDAGECCPDFSCCRPSLLVPRAVREAFVSASDEQRGRMLMVFLGSMIAEAVPDKKIHIAGSGEQS